MDLNAIPRDKKFWFYFRKGLFQGFFPVILAILSFYGFSNKDTDSIYGHLYFYTSLILLIYISVKHLLSFIFTVCAEKIIFKKEINPTHSMPDTLYTLEINENLDKKHCMVISKKIFKIRYSDKPFFIYVEKICWYLGIDCPMLISKEIIDKLSNYREDITINNEETILHSTLLNLSTYSPHTFNIVPDKNSDEEISIEDDLDIPYPKIIVTKIDRSINDLQRDLFNRINEVYDPTV